MRRVIGLVARDVWREAVGWCVRRLFAVLDAGDLLGKSGDWVRLGEAWAEVGRATWAAVEPFVARALAEIDLLSKSSAIQFFRRKFRR